MFEDEQYSHGLKLGAIVGLVSSLILIGIGLLWSFVLYLRYGSWNILTFAGYNMISAMNVQMLATFYLLLAGIFIIAGTVAGMAGGLLYVELQDAIPGEHSVQKAFYLFIGIWALFNLLPNTASLLQGAGFSAVSFSALLGLSYIIPYSYLYGRHWPSFNDGVFHYVRSMT